MANQTIPESVCASRSLGPLAVHTRDTPSGAQRPLTAPGIPIPDLCGLMRVLKRPQIRLQGVTLRLRRAKARTQHTVVATQISILTRRNSV